VRPCFQSFLGPCRDVFIGFAHETLLRCHATERGKSEIVRFSIGDENLVFH
jgi:hypothetical protein